MALQYFRWNLTHHVFHPYILPRYKPDRPALEVHEFWCKAGIYSWNISENVYLMLADIFKIHFFVI